MAASSSFRSGIVLLLICFLVSVSSGALDIVMPAGTPPRLFMTEDEMMRLRARAKDPQWEKQCAGLLKEADSCLENVPAIPHQGGQWTHWYSCPKDGGSFITDTPTAHRCSVCGEVYSGYPYDDAYITYMHNRYNNNLQTIAIAYVIEPTGVRAKHIRDSLLEYASFYEDLPLHDRDGNTTLSAARLYAQTLDESVNLCKFCFAYDLVYGDPCFSEEDHRIIKEHLLLPMCETIQRYDMRISNWQTWHNSAVGCAGLLTGERELVDWAINGKSGLMFQMERSVLSGGMWYEGAPGYHWYSFHALYYLLEAAGRAGMNLWNLPPVKRMLDGPLRQLYPDLTFPAIHDSPRTSILGNRGFYEMGYSHFKDERYLPLLTVRDSRDALLYGADSLPEEKGALTLDSYNDDEEALAVLRNPDGKTAVFLDYTRARVGHMHPATVNLLLFAQGEERLAEAGRLPYGNPLHKEWCRQTVSHNTVVVNETSHKRIESACTFFEVGEGWRAARAMATLDGEKYALNRTVVLADKAVIDIFRCRSKEDALFDLPLHFRGEWADLPEMKEEAVSFEVPGYREFREVKEAVSHADWYTLATGASSRIVLQIADAGQQFVGRSPGYQYEENLPMLMRRLSGKEAVFVTVFHLLEGDAVPDAARCSTDASGTVTVQTGGLTVQADENALRITP